MKFTLNQRRNVVSIRSLERSEEPDDRWSNRALIEFGVVWNGESLLEPTRCLPAKLHVTPSSRNFVEAESL